MNTHFKAIHEQYVFWLETLGFTPETVCNYGYRVTDFFCGSKAKTLPTLFKSNKSISTIFLTANRPAPIPSLRAER